MVLSQQCPLDNSCHLPFSTCFHEENETKKLISSARKLFTSVLSNAQTLLKPHFYLTNSFFSSAMFWSLHIGSFTLKTCVRCTGCSSEAEIPVTNLACFLNYCLEKDKDPVNFYNIFSAPRNSMLSLQLLWNDNGCLREILRYRPCFQPHPWCFVLHHMIPSSHI